MEIEPEQPGNEADRRYSEAAKAVAVCDPIHQPLPRPMVHRFGVAKVTGLGEDPGWYTVTAQYWDTEEGDGGEYVDAYDDSIHEAKARAANPDLYHAFLVDDLVYFWEQDQVDMDYEIVIAPLGSVEFWAKITGMQAGDEHPNMGYTWTMVRASYPDDANDLTWTNTAFTSASDGADYAFEINSIAVGYTGGTSANGQIVRMVATVDDEGKTIFQFIHSESDIYHVASINNSVPASTLTVTESAYQWNKFLGFTHGGAASKWDTATPPRLYDGIEMMICVRFYATLTWYTPIFRLFRWDAQGHLISIGPEVHATPGPPG